jgi:hypothetical protein
MESRNELLRLIEELSEEEIPHAIAMIKKLIKTQHESEKSLEPLEIVVPVTALAPLDAFMATIVHSLTNTMYDLSLDAKRKEDKVMAKRLEAYRKKVSDGWEIYRKSKEKE